MCTPLACTCGTVEQWRTLRTESPHTSYLPASSPQLADKLEVAESNDDHVGVKVDIRDFNTTGYKRINLWLRIDQIHDVPHSPCDVPPAHADELQASFRYHGIDYSHRLTWTGVNTLLFWDIAPSPPKGTCSQCKTNSE